MVRAPATAPDEIRCKGCGTVSPHADTVQSRRHGWRVGWQPGHPSWCPVCYDSKGLPRLRAAAPAPYDEPLF